MRDSKSWTRRIADGAGELALPLIEEALWSDTLRRSVLRQIERRVIAGATADDGGATPPRVLADRADMIRAMLESIGRGLDRGVISRRCLRGVLKVLSNVSFLQDAAARAAAERFAERHGGRTPPGTIVVSPTGACNLRCPGCYAAASAHAARLEGAVFDRILREAEALWALRFLTISGGEPFVYRSAGQDLLDVLGRHEQSFFLVYTNGTLIDERLARRMAELGNITPAISVEGFAGRTDARRGPGVFARILEAMAALREAGVPFGISLTVTRENAEEVFSDEFIDFFFDRQQATYGWVFQYMPIGRHRTLDLLPAPEQRLWMWQRIWEIIRKRKIMFADFWNCGTVTSGCISAAKPSGYLYIDWNGKVMPCVFVPYAAANILEIYRSGGTLDDVYDAPYFEAIRRWQSEYRTCGGPGGNNGNWLLPCPIRDHYAEARQLIDRYRPEPENREAGEALEDPAYRQGMIAYDEQLRQLFEPVWQSEYLSRMPAARA